MGIKNLWPLLTPYCERKSISFLTSKIFAIDLAGWVCESLNTVDYFVHPRQYLKNLYFRTCYLLLEGVIPVFILEGKAPKLKQNVISKRNEIQFRGVKPKNPQNAEKSCQQQKSIQNNEKIRTRFNQVLKQCENLLKCMGIACVQAPGEAEAYAAFLQKKGLVHGVISQDSDCFAYGASIVLRNFSICAGGNSTASVDVYDMGRICQHIDFGQNKIILMALICGCDYFEGVSGVGKDSVLKFFSEHTNDDILERVRSWKSNSTHYKSLEMKVDDKNICSNCGHLGKTITHTKNGCQLCRTVRNCDERLWKERRLSIKAELLLRRKALSQDAQFPPEEVILEFLTEPKEKPTMNLNWSHPNLVKFIKVISTLIQWTEIYSFQKFFPLLTRWLVRFPDKVDQINVCVVPEKIIKKRTVRGVPSFEIIWKDEKNCFSGLIPGEQIQSFLAEEPKDGISSLWTTVEPQNLFEAAYPKLVEEFLISKEKPKKSRSTKRKKLNNSFHNMSGLIEATEEISRKTKKSKKSKLIEVAASVQPIEKFCIKLKKSSCSTPKSSRIDVDWLALENESESCDLNLSEIVNGIINSKPENLLYMHDGKKLCYEKVNTKDYENLNGSKDDLEILKLKRKLSSKHCLEKLNLSNYENRNESTDDLILLKSKRKDCSLAKKVVSNIIYLSPEHSNEASKNFKDEFNDNVINYASNSSMADNSNNLAKIKNHIDIFFGQQKTKNLDITDNRSYFFEASIGCDEFEKSFCSIPSQKVDESTDEENDVN